MSVRRRTLLGMASGAGSIVIKTGLNLLVIPLMVTRLGMDMFGLYILLVGILEIAVLLDFGVTPALATLLSGKEGIGKAARGAIDKAADLGDADTADLFTGISRSVDKHLWLVESHLQAAD